MIEPDDEESGYVPGACAAKIRARNDLGKLILATMTRPPNDRGQGRKPLPEASKLVVGSIRLSPAQWEKLERLGGAAWLRERIDRARLTSP
jgi:hypothetical protein